MPNHELIAAAREARELAYAPYSGYKVGAAIRSADGRVFGGCNVENISYGLSICAERSAAFQMIAAGANEIAEVAVVTADGGTPCGACLQVLSEFTPDPGQVSVHCVAASSETKTYTLAELLPHGFRSASVKRTEPLSPESSL